MITYVTESEFVDRMSKEGFSYNGCVALYEYLEEVSPDSVFDPVAIRCEFSEYASAAVACGDLGMLVESESAGIELLEANTSVIPFDGGVIIADF